MEFLSNAARGSVIGKAIPVQALEALRVARDRGSHIFRYSAHRCRQRCQPYTT
jgi:hypothetical protein